MELDTCMAQCEVHACTTIRQDAAQDRVVSFGPTGLCHLYSSYFSFQLDHTGLSTSTTQSTGGKKVSCTCIA